MRKDFILLRLVAGAVLSAGVAFGQGETPGDPTPTPTLPVIGVPTVTPTPESPLGTPISTPTSNPDVTPVPAITPPPERAAEPSAVTSSSTFEYSEKGAPVFTLDKAVITALHQNPDFLKALQEIERTKGVIIQVRAEALPRINATGELTWTDPSLNRNSSFSSTGGTPAPTPIVVARIVDAPASQLRDVPIVMISREYRRTAGRYSVCPKA
jgi:hypothetical protein